MNPTVAKKYREHRRTGLPARIAWMCAKAAERPSLGLEWRGGKARCERDGFQIKVTVEQDESPDFSHLGEFTSHYEPGALDLKKLRKWESGTYQYFVPTQTEDEYFIDLRGMGYGKHAARLQARAYVLADYERAKEYTAWVVGVRAYKNGIDLGGAGIGGYEFDDTKSFEAEAESAIAEHGLIEEAIDEARKALAKLCQCKEATPPV